MIQYWNLFCKNLFNSFSIISSFSSQSYYGFIVSYFSKSCYFYLYRVYNFSIFYFVVYLKVRPKIDSLISLQYFPLGGILNLSN